MTLPAPSGTPYRVGFVCLGNICRSPMADVILSDLVEGAGLTARVEVTSCGTGTWHLGEPMDPRAAAQLSGAGYDPSEHRAKAFTPEWLTYDLLLAMDEKNLAEIMSGITSGITPGTRRDSVRLFRSFDPLAPADPGPGDLDVPDPWFGGDEGFVEVIGMVERTCRSLLGELQTLDL
ncbi:MAG: low molecular weight protein-tyrosine-phosphatase [Marmoricola sp.]